MALDAIITRYGLFAIFVGSGVEGEPFAVAGGFLAHRALFPLWATMAAATTGSWLIDQFWFLVGRRFRDHRWVRSTVARPAFARSLGMLERHPTWFVLLFRFAYGLRAVAPIAIGASRVPARRFVPLNMLAAAIWGPAFTMIGYGLGRSVARWTRHASATGISLAALSLVVVAMAGTLAVRRLRAGR